MHVRSEIQAAARDLCIWLWAWSAGWHQRGRMVFALITSLLHLCSYLEHTQVAGRGLVLLRPGHLWRAPNPAGAP